jgi:hypothetical protein
METVVYKHFRCCQPHRPIISLYTVAWSEEYYPKSLSLTLRPSSSQLLQPSFHQDRNIPILVTNTGVLDFGCSVNLAFGRDVPRNRFRFDVSIVHLPFITDLAQVLYLIIRDVLSKLFQASLWRLFSNTGSTSWPRSIAVYGFEPMNTLDPTVLANYIPRLFLHILRRRRI